MISLRVDYVVTRYFLREVSGVKINIMISICDKNQPFVMPSSVYKPAEPVIIATNATQSEDVT